MYLTAVFFVCIVQCGDALNTSLEGVRQSGASGGGGDEALNTSSDSAISTYSAVSTCPSVNDVTAERGAGGKENRQPVAPGAQRQRVKKTLKTSSRDRSNSSSRTPRGKQQQMAPPAAVPVAVGKKQNTPRGGHAGGAAATTRLPLRNDHNNKV